MSNLLKSKFLLGVLVVSALVGGVALLGGPLVASADCSITHTLRVGSIYHSEVMCLQTALGGLTVDGSFGPKTKAAVVAWQAKEGLVADGIFGPKSNAVWMANQVNVGVFPPGCTSAVGFSPTTGAPCNGVVVVGNLPAGCTSTAGFSPITGVSCSVMTNLPAGCSSTAGYSPTTGVKCDSTGVVAPSGTNGYLADIASDSSNRVSTVYESEQDKVVAGFRATARLADQTVNRVRVQFRNTDSVGSSPSLGKYISSASLWFGSTKIATMSVADADRSTSDDTYTFNFSGISAKVLRDQIGRFYVSVTANGSLDSTDTTNANWAVVFPDGGVQAVSPDGSVDTYNMSAGNVGTLTGSNVGFTFGKFSANGVKATINLSSSNPAATSLAVNNTSQTNGVTILKFTVKATNSSLTLRKVPIQIVATGNNVSAIVNTIKLYKGANLVDSVDGSSGFVVNTALDTPVVGFPAGAITSTTTAGATTTGYIFSNLSSPDNMINSGDTAEFSIVIDIKAQSNFTAGDTIKASFTNADALLTANFGVLDVNGDQLTAGSTYRVGSAVGEVMTLLVNGINVVMGTPSYTTVTDSGNVTQVTYTIPVTATAFGQTLYMGQTVQLATTATGTNAFSLSFQDSTAPSTNVDTCTSCSFTLASDATVEGSGFRMDSGTAKHFTITVVEITPTTAARSYRVQLNQARTFTDNALSAGASNQNLLPVQNFQTGYQFITS